MKTKTACFIICVFFFSLTAYGQGQDIKKPYTATSETKMDLSRNIRLVNDSKPEEISINIQQKTKWLNLSINSTVSSGKLTIELYDPNNVKQGNFTVETQLNSIAKETVSGNFQKSLLNPQVGNWKVKIIPTEASGMIKIQSDIVEY